MLNIPVYPENTRNNEKQWENDLGKKLTFSQYRPKSQPLDKIMTKISTKLAQNHELERKTT